MKQNKKQIADVSFFYTMWLKIDVSRFWGFVNCSKNKKVRKSMSYRRSSCRIFHIIININVIGT